MGSSALKKYGKELLDVGKKLLALPSAVDELLMLLEKAEQVLCEIGQQPRRSTQVVLIPLMKALITDGLLRHNDVKVQIAVACCFNELTRISAPSFTYNDREMKEFFQLCMIVLKHISTAAGCNYDRAMRMLETMAKLKSCVILLDIDCDGLIVEMFQLFFSSIRSHHPASTFKYMEMIINLVIQETDEITFKLLGPLLDSVKMDNKNISQISWELGNAVFRSCSDKLENPLKEIVKDMNLNVGDYAEIVTSLCQRTSSAKKRVANAGSTDGSAQSDELSNDEPKDYSWNAKDYDQDAWGLYNEVEVLERETGSFQKRRGRKPLLSKQYDASKNQEKDAGASVEEGKNSKGGWKKKNKSMTNQQTIPKSSTFLKKKHLQTNVKKNGSKIKNTTVQGDISGSSLIVEKMGDFMVLDATDSKEDDELTHFAMHKNEQLQNDIISKKHESNNVKKGIRRFRPGSDEDIIALRVKVWWPDDMEYYTGTVVSYDHLTNKHEILYDDGDTEILNMDEEIWERCNDQNFNHYELQPPVPAKEPIETLEKRAKRKPGLFKKQNASSSSKRLKGEKVGGIKSGEVSSPTVFLIKDESNIKMHEGTNIVDNKELYSVDLDVIDE